MPNNTLLTYNLSTDRQVEGDRHHSAVEVSIEKYEKTALQWLQEQTQNNSVIWEHHFIQK